MTAAEKQQAGALSSRKRLFFSFALIQLKPADPNAARLYCGTSPAKVECWTTGEKCVQTPRKYELNFWHAEGSIPPPSKLEKSRSSRLGACARLLSTNGVLVRAPHE